MKPEDKRHLIKFIIVAILACALAFLAAWLTAIFAVLKLTQGASLLMLTFIILWCALIGGSIVWIISAFCWLVLGILQKQRIHKIIRLGNAMSLLHATTNHEMIETIRHYNIRIFKALDTIPAEGMHDVECREISGFLFPLPFGFNKFFAFGSPEYGCDAAQIMAIVENNHQIWNHISVSGKNSTDNTAKLARELENFKQKYKEMTQLYTSASGREAKLKDELAKTELHMQILVELASSTTKEARHPLTKNEIARKYKDIGQLLGIETAPNSYIEIFRKSMPKEYINHGGAPAQTT